MNELSELVEYLTWSDFRITFDTTSNGIFRATVSHPSGKMQTFVGGISTVVRQIENWVHSVLTT